MKMGEKIAKARKVQNMTQEQLADCLEVTRQSVSRWESDLAYPEVDKLVKLAEILQINCDYLLKEDVTECGEKIVQVEVASNDVGLFKKLNWSFILSLVGMFWGIYIIGMFSLVLGFSHAQIFSSSAIIIVFFIIILVIGISILVPSCIFFTKGMKRKEYFIKKQYK